MFYVDAITKLTIVCKKHGEFETTPYNHFASSHGGCRCCIMEKILVSNGSKYLRKLEQKYGDKIRLIDYVDSSIINLDEKRLFNCKAHGNFIKPPRNVLHSKKGCPECANESLKDKRVGDGYGKAQGSVNWSNLESRPELANRDSFLYIVRLSNDIETFYKVGVSNYDSFYFRFRCYTKTHSVELIHLRKTTMLDAYEMEQLIVNTIERYKPIKKFQGYTECFKSNVLDLLDGKELTFERSTTKVGGKLTQHVKRECYEY